MALSVKSSFSAGELDPALHERTTLNKYASGLATARNVIIGKTGRILSRPGRKHLFSARYTNSPIRVHTFAHDDYKFLIEIGTAYFRLYQSYQDGAYTLVETVAHFYSAAQIPLLQFVNHLERLETTNAFYPTVIVFCEGETPVVYKFQGSPALYGPFGTTGAPTVPSVNPTGPPTGYDVSYAVSVVRDGEESLPTPVNSGKLPITSGHWNTITTTVGTAASTNKVTEIRVYRKPLTGGAYGYIGSSTTQSTTGGGLYQYDFLDYGQAADYTHTPITYIPTLLDAYNNNPLLLESRTGTLYQQRLVFSSQKGIEASRVGFPYNLTRDYPYNAASGLSFSDARDSKVIWIVEAEGVVIFTTTGIYLNSGALSYANLSLDKKGNWVADENVPPIAIPGGVLFVDRATNTVRHLAYSLENGSYVGEELSIFSNHLFEETRITSWAFEDGPFPLLWVTFNNGTYASFTYEKEHEMRAWTRHDSGVDIEYVASLRGVNNEGNSQVFFVVKNGSNYSVEQALPRYVTPEDLEDNPEADKGEAIAAMDSVVSWSSLVNEDDTLTDLTGSLVGGDLFAITPVTPGDWDGPLTVTCGTSAIFTDPGPGSTGVVFRLNNSPIELTVTARASDNSITVTPSETYPSETAAADIVLYQVTDKTITVTPVITDTWDGELTLDCAEGALFVDPGPGTVGAILRWFNPVDKASIDLEVTARASNNSITVQPSEEFPSDYATAPRIYLTAGTVSGLDHLEGEDVSVISDGFVIASPNNDILNYPTITVSGGSIDLPNELTGAIIHVGRPYVMDIETLDIDTVEQRPVLIESKTVNKVYIKTHQSRGLYVGNRFPDDDTVLGNDETGTFMSTMDGLDSYEVNNELQNPITGNRYDQPTSRRYEAILPGDWNSNGRVCIRQVDPLHFEILSIIPDLEDLRR